jgi:hypothetical protein
MISIRYKVFWTDEAKYSIGKVIEHLRDKWSEKEVNAFLDEVDRIINLIEIYPKLFKSSRKRNNVHMALIDKHTFLVYQIRTNKKQIALLLFWGTPQNPKALKY